MAIRNRYLDQARMGLQGVGGGIMGDPRMQMQRAQMQAFQAQEAAQMQQARMQPPPAYGGMRQQGGGFAHAVQRMTPEARQQHHVMRPGEMPGLGQGLGGRGGFRGHEIERERLRGEQQFGVQGGPASDFAPGGKWGPSLGQGLGAADQMRDFGERTAHVGQDVGGYQPGEREEEAMAQAIGGGDAAGGYAMDLENQKRAREMEGLRDRVNIPESPGITPRLQPPGQATELGQGLGGGGLYGRIQPPSIPERQPPPGRFPGGPG